jgi:hypothetical protein
MSETRATEMIFGLPSGSPIPSDEPPAADPRGVQPAGQIPIETISVEEAAAIVGVDPAWLWDVVEEMRRG